MMIRSVRLWRLAALLFALCAMLGGCRAPDAPREAVVRLDGEVRIDAGLCTGCGLCSQICPVQAIGGVTHE